MKNLLNTAIAKVALAVSLPAAAQMSDDVVKRGPGNDPHAPARRAQVAKQRTMRGKQ